MLNVNNLFKPFFVKNITNNINNKIANVQEQISSGSRLKNSGTDPTAFLISEDLKVDINAYNQLKNNLEDSISFLDSFEAGVAETVEILNRMNVILLNASNDTQNDDNLKLLKSELDGLIDSLDENADKLRQINSRLFLDTLEGNEILLRNGINKGDEVRLNIKNLSSKGLGLESLNILDKEELNVFLSKVQENISDLALYRNEIGRISSSFQQKINLFDDLRLNNKTVVSKLRDTDAAEAVLENTKLDLQSKMINQTFKSIINMDKLKTDRLLSLLNK